MIPRSGASDVKQIPFSGISLLGSFGTGKTWFCRHYAYRRLLKYLDNPVHERLPLLITLRAFTKSSNVRQLLNDVFIEQYKLPFVGSAFDVFKSMSQRGKILLILDGFDEMALQVDDQTVVQNFFELKKLITENSKVILTSRTEYFRRAKESERIFSGEEELVTGAASEAARFEVLYIDPLDEKRIRQIVNARLGPRTGEQTADRLLADSRMREMLTRPVLVELLLAVINDVSIETIKSPSHVYLHATHSLLIRNIAENKTFTFTRDKVLFLCELAWEMLTTGELRVHYSSIPSRIYRHFAGRIQSTHELDLWDFDLRNQTLLHRDTAGNYEFAHKSLAEYFVALKLGGETGCLSSAFHTTYRERDLSVATLPYEGRPARELGFTFGSRDLAGEDFRAVRDMLGGVIDGNSVGGLWSVLEGTRGVDPEALRYTAANAVLLLKQRGESLRGRDFSGMVLSRAVLVPDLREARFERTELKGVDLSDCDLRGADLTHAVLDPGSLAGADLREARGLDTVPWFAASSLSPHHHALTPVPAFDAIRAFVEKEENGALFITGGPRKGKTVALSVAMQEAGTRDFLVFAFSPRPGTSSNAAKTFFYRELSTFVALRGVDIRTRVDVTAELWKVKEQIWEELLEATGSQSSSSASMISIWSDAWICSSSCLLSARCIIVSRSKEAAKRCPRRDPRTSPGTRQRRFFGCPTSDFVSGPHAGGLRGTLVFAFGGDSTGDPRSPF